MPGAPENGSEHVIDARAFAALMAPMEPFERAPRLAVAVSGGPDSLALCLLADAWARARGGSAMALTVDHGLRPESGDDARCVHGWLEPRGIRHVVLTWAGPKPKTGIQAAARAARHRLLADWCRQAHVLHLLLAQQRDDQAETFLMRHERASGPDGLAGMAPVREVPGLRLLRPLLGVPKARLVATLQGLGQPWLEDPSNHAPAFARTRLRRAAAPRSARYAAEAAAWGRRRAAADDRTAAWLVRAARIHPAGFVLVDWPALRAAPRPIAARGLRQILLALGASAYPPRRVRLERLLQELCEDAGARGRTLGGCCVLPQGERLLFCREAGAIRAVVEPVSGVWLRWDERFAIRVTGEVGGVTIRALGEDGWRRRRCLAAVGAPAPLPRPAAYALPALWRGAELIMVPHLNLVAPATSGRVSAEVRLEPRAPLAGPRFAATSAPRLCLEAPKAYVIC